MTRDRAARIWDATTAEPWIPPLLHDQGVVQGFFSADGRRVLTVSEDNSARVWDADSGEALTPPIAHVANSSSSCLSASGRYFLTIHPEYVACVWDLHSSNSVVARLKPLRGTAFGDASSTGSSFVLQENSLIRIRGVNSGLGVPLHPLSVKTAPLQSWFDSTESFLIVETEMATAQVWDIASGTPITPRLKSEYSLDPRVYKQLDLPTCKLPTDQLLASIELLSGNRLDGTGGWSPLKLEQIVQLWGELSSSELFAPNGVSLVRWHESEAERAGARLDWFGALFHLKRLQRLDRGNERLADRREHAFASLVQAQKASPVYALQRRAIPPRDPRANNRLIDLTEHYSTKDIYYLAGQSHHLSLPVGIQRLGGIDFDIRGAVELGSLETKRRGESRPDHVAGIKIHQLCQRIHFLHCTQWGAQEDQAIATITIQFRDGRKESIEIRTGVHIASDWTAEPVQPEQAEVVWVGAYPVANSFRRSVRLVKYTWVNPFPNNEVAHLNIASLQAKSAYCLVALTVE